MFFINVGRGQTTNTDDLLEALREHQLAGAGLDVFEQEPLPADHPFWQMENVIITPHSSGSTKHFNERACAMFLRNLHEYIQGDEPSVNRIHAGARY